MLNGADYTARRLVAFCVTAAENEAMWQTFPCVLQFETVDPVSQKVNL